MQLGNHGWTDTVLLEKVSGFLKEIAQNEGFLHLKTCDDEVEAAKLHLMIFGDSQDEVRGCDWNCQRG